MSARTLAVWPRRRKREAEEHGSGAPLKHRAAASWVSSAPDRRPGLERQVGEAGQFGQRGADPFRFFLESGGAGCGGSPLSGRCWGSMGAVSRREAPGDTHGTRGEEG